MHFAVFAIVCVASVMAQVPPMPDQARFLGLGTLGQIQPYWGMSQSMYGNYVSWCRINCQNQVINCGQLCVMQPFGPQCRLCMGQQHMQCNSCTYYNNVYQPWSPAFNTFNPGMGLGIGAGGIWRKK